MIKYENSIGPGWTDIVKPLINYCENNNIQILQIKEKFGNLRFYYCPIDKTLETLVTAAEHLTESTCEWCGEPGSRRNTGWVKTLCDEHAEVWNTGKRW